VAVRNVAGRRYALAVLDLAREAGDLDRWLRALEGLEGLTANAGYVAALQGDGMTDEKFGAIVRDVVPTIGELELNLFRLLRRKNRLALGPSIASYFRELVDEERNVARATIRTAVPLDEQQRAAIQQRLSQQTGRSVELEAEVDPDILGGAVIRIGDELIDGSMRRRLQRLREELAGARA
jgi:F-type H+-transporting ATPase subunit delta